MQLFPEWQTAPAPVPYPEAVATMEARVAAIRAGEAAEQVWLLEHPPLYTAGTSANPADLLDPGAFPVYATGRGGQYTYHGPGQRVLYVMLDLRARDNDIRQHVRRLEQWLINTLSGFDVRAERRAGRVGLWVEEGGREAKIAAIGVRVRHGVTYHGAALNIAPNLSHFSGIIPCGLTGYGVTSLAALGKTADMAAVDQALRASWPGVFAG